MDKLAPESLYGIDNWGSDFVTVLENGEVAIKNPLDTDAEPVSLPNIISDLRTRGIQTPVLLRVESFLAYRIKQLNECFRDAIAQNEYQGSYRGVFPIKVNQQAHVVERIVRYGQAYDYGLEAGSKPELVIALSQALSSNSLIICNGVKDEEFVRLAILSNRLGFNTYIVLESPKELETVIRVSKALNMEPLLGVRIKLTHRIGGKWEESSGDRSTFGMNTEQLVTVIDTLRQHDLLHTLKLQHSHLGSQIPDVIDVRHAVTEACRYFTELSAEGVELTHLDLGGGLGIDYTGEHRAIENSINYSMEEYCANIIETVRYAMDEAKLKHPTIVTESGRAVVAMSSLLVMDVLETTLYDAQTAPATEETDHHLLKDLAAVESYTTPSRLQECINDARYYRNELRALFRRGYVPLRSMAKGERIFLYLMAQIKRVAEHAEHASEIDAQLNEMADIYHCNFSLFQSLPDMWAIDQLHPIAPLQRLNERPDRRAILSDITCDSDGKIDRFILTDGIESSLPVHSFAHDEAYYLGVFFVGAYQETLGDLHNLFGDTNVATIDFNPDGGIDLIHELEGDTIAEVMSYVEYEPKSCMDSFRKVVDRSVSEGKISNDERKVFIDSYRDSINGYTYYE